MENWIPVHHECVLRIIEVVAVAKVCLTLTCASVRMCEFSQLLSGLFNEKASSERWDYLHYISLLIQIVKGFKSFFLAWHRKAVLFCFEQRNKKEKQPTTTEKRKTLWQIKLRLSSHQHTAVAEEAVSTYGIRIPLSAQK